MTIMEHRKRKLLHDIAPVPLEGTRKVPSQRITTVFLLYDRESERDRDLVQRLRTTLEKNQFLKCSNLYSDTSGWVLKSYGEKLETADKVVAMFSADFLKSEEASFVFEMARTSCMERRENKIIIASKSRRNLPKAYDGFPRVKMSKQSWIQDLVKEIRKPATQISKNTWTYNKEGYKNVNIQELYKECENTISTSMPTLECLERPPTLPKSVADTIMIWNRFQKGPKSPEKALGRAQSQRSKHTPDVQGITEIRKSSSFCKDRETLEFVTRYCRSKHRRRQSRKSSSSSRPSSGFFNMSSPPVSPFWAKTGPNHQVFPYWGSPPPTTPTKSFYGEKESSSINAEINKQPEQDSCCQPDDNCCKKKKLAYTASAYSKGENEGADSSIQSEVQIHLKRKTTPETGDLALAVIMAAFIKAMQNPSQGCPETFAIDQQSSGLEEDTSKDSAGDHSTQSSNVVITPYDHVSLVNVLPVQSILIQAPVTQYAALPDNPMLKASIKIPRREETVSNLDVVEFDTAFRERPHEFRRVKFDNRDGDFVVHLGETVWLQTFKACRIVSIRKRNGRTGKIPKVLLCPYIDNVVTDGKKNVSSIL